MGKDNISEEHIKKLAIFAKGIKEDFKKDTLKIFMNAFFGQEDMEDTDLDDLCKEIANQIIGKAKNLLNEKEPNAYKLGTPEFLGEVENFGIKLKEKFIYKIKNRTFQIGYKIQ